jgi:hypothetical protein
MLELKIQCDCGQKIKFDVEPVNNQMPFTLNCPACGADATAKGNAQLTLLASSQNAPEQPRLRINSPAAPVASSSATGEAQIYQRPARYEPSAMRANESNAQKGLAGAVGGALIGLGIWYLLFKSVNSGSRFPSLMGRPDNAAYFMVVIGLLAGFGAWIFGGRGIDPSLGMTAAISTVVVILIGQFIFVHLIVDKLAMGLVSANDFFNKVYWKTFWKSISQDGTTITFAVLAVAAAYVAGWGLIAKVSPRK